MRTLMDMVSRMAADTLPGLGSEVAREVQYWELTGCDGPSPYTKTLHDLDRLIGNLKRSRAEVQAMQSHAHIWNDNDYCAVCGMDGRA